MREVPLDSTARLATSREVPQLVEGKLWVLPVAGSSPVFPTIHRSPQAMGTYKIIIDGTGPHHNGHATDAEVMVRDFVGKLKVAGHIVQAANFQLVSLPEDVTKPILPPAIITKTEQRPHAG